MIELLLTLIKPFISTDLYGFDFYGGT